MSNPMQWVRVNNFLSLEVRLKRRSSEKHHRPDVKNISIPYMLADDLNFSAVAHA